MNKRKTIVLISASLLIFIITFGLIYISTQNKKYESKIKFDKNYINGEIISNSYITNGFDLQITILNAINPSILLVNDKEKIELPLTHIHDNDYKINIIVDNLQNQKYEIYIKDNEYASPIINKLDLLEQLVRSKINNKLITFDYTNNYMSFKLENFKYEYDILIDPGHGGIDAGTLNKVIDEASFNLLQSLYEKERYEEHGLKVLLSREDDGDGMLTGSEEWNRAKQRGYAIGYYGVTSKIVYSNHHNSAYNSTTSGFEVLVSNTLDENNLKTELQIINEINQKYPSTLINNKFQIYSRDYETGDTFNKINAKVYSYRDYYATIRIPLELYNVKTVTYEGCYMSNQNDFDWYYNKEGWKIVSEIKIKNYVESLGKTYIPV